MRTLGNTIKSHISNLKVTLKLINKIVSESLQSISICFRYPYNILNFYILIQKSDPYGVTILSLGVVRVGEII